MSAIVHCDLLPCFGEKLEKPDGAVGAQDVSRNADRARPIDAATRALLRENRKNRGSACGTWIGRRYRGGNSYDTTALGAADDLTNADGLKVFDFWQAQSAARQWAEKQRLIDEGMVRGGPYTVADAVQDYLGAIRAEKGPAAERNANYIFTASILPEFGSSLVEKLTASICFRPKAEVRSP